MKTPPVAALLAVALAAVVDLTAKKSKDPPPSVAEQGRKVYLKLNCADCHRIAGSGGSFGPNLTHVGRTRSAAWIRKKVTDSKDTNSKSMMPPYKLPAKDLDALVAYLAGLK